MALLWISSSTAWATCDLLVISFGWSDQTEFESEQKTTYTWKEKKHCQAEAAHKTKRECWKVKLPVLSLLQEEWSLKGDSILTKERLLWILITVPYKYLSSVTHTQDWQKFVSGLGMCLRCLKGCQSQQKCTNGTNTRTHTNCGMEALGFFVIFDKGCATFLCKLRFLHCSCVLQRWGCDWHRSWSGEGLTDWVFSVIYAAVFGALARFLQHFVQPFGWSTALLCGQAARHTCSLVSESGAERYVSAFRTEVDIAWQSKLTIDCFLYFACALNWTTCPSTALSRLSHNPLWAQII